MPSRRLSYREIDIPQRKKNEWDTENVIQCHRHDRESHLYAPRSALILKVVGATAAELNEVSFVLCSIDIEDKIGKMISTDTFGNE
jgi:hypothetical protein